MWSQRKAVVASHRAVVKCCVIGTSSKLADPRCSQAQHNYLPIPSLPICPHAPLAASRTRLLLFAVVLSAIPLSIYLAPFTFPHIAATMPRDLKKLMPQARSEVHHPLTTEVAGVQKVDGETIPRRNAKTAEELKLTPNEDIKTLYDILRYSSAKFGNAKAVGTRRTLNVHEETKKIKKMVDGKEQEVDKKWQYFELGPYEWKSFVEFEQLCVNVGAAIKQLGFVPHDRIHLFGATSMQWLSSAHGK